MALFFFLQTSSYVSIKVQYMKPLLTLFDVGILQQWPALFLFVTDNYNYMYVKIYGQEYFILIAFW